MASAWIAQGGRITVAVFASAAQITTGTRSQSMTRVGLLSSAILALLFAGTFPIQTNRFGSNEAPARARGSVPEALKQPSDVWSNPAARRWLHSQPNHWRAMLLNR